MQAIVGTVRAWWLPLASALIVSVVDSFSPTWGLVFSGLGLVVITGWVLFMLGRIVIAAFRGTWRQALVATLILTGVWPFAAALLFSGDYIHLALLYPSYAVKISAAAVQPGRVSFVWSGTGFAGAANSERSLVYDVTGQLAQEIGGRSLPKEPAVWVTTNHLIGSFYIVESSW